MGSNALLYPRPLLGALALSLLGISPCGAAAGTPVQAAGQAAPIPPGERELRAVVAGRPVLVPGAAKDLEGPVFLPDGTLVFSDVEGGRIMRLDAQDRVTAVVKLAGLNPGGIALSPNGRLYIAAANASGGGAIVSMRPDGTGQQTIVPESAGFAPNDIAFDARGGFYFTDARGTIGEPAGGVWYVAPDGSSPKPVLRNLAVANGIALSPDGKRLWVGEFAMGRLYRIDLKDATTPAPFGATTAYHFTGPAPDSMRIDGLGQLYVALYGQGRVLVFSSSGLPIGQILLPGRDAGRNLSTTSMALGPDGAMVVVTSDGIEGGNATIFRARSFDR